MVGNRVAEAEVKTINFKGDGVAEVEIISWKEKGIKVINDKGIREFYYYVEIISIGSESLEDLKWKIVFQKMWSGVKDRIALLSKNSQKKKQFYNINGTVFKNVKELCNNIKNSKVIKFYDKEGVLSHERTCVRGQKTVSKKYYPDGAIQRIT